MPAYTHAELSTWTLEKLKQLCRDKAWSGFSKHRRKEELIEFILLHQPLHRSSASASNLASGGKHAASSRPASPTPATAVAPSAAQQRGAGKPRRNSDGAAAVASASQHQQQQHQQHHHHSGSHSHHHSYHSSGSSANSASGAPSGRHSPSGHGSSHLSKGVAGLNPSNHGSSSSSHHSKPEGGHSHHHERDRHFPNLITAVYPPVYPTVVYAHQAPLPRKEQQQLQPAAKQQPLVLAEPLPQRR